MMIKNFKSLSTTSLRKKSLQILDAGLGAIKTEKIIKENITLKNNYLTIKIKKFDLNKYKNIFVIGFGKASSLMAKEIEKILKNKIDGGIVISTKKIRLGKIKVYKGTHPMPSLKNISYTKKIVNLITKLDKNDLVLCLISGGGSALLCYPNVSFDRYKKIIDKSFNSGIDINKLNKIRKKYSNVKGGKLAKLTKAKIISLIFSDVVSDDLATIASGPTYGKGKRADNILLLNNKVALEAMNKKAVTLGLNPFILTNKLKGEAKFTGKKILNDFKNIKQRKSKISVAKENLRFSVDLKQSFKHLKTSFSNNKKINCLLFAGETTVTVRGNGKGGRNQELCLGAIKDISKFKNAILTSIGTDGIDGTTDAAGAIVDNDSFKKSINKKLDYKEYLKNNDSYNFFKKIDGLVFTGLTGSNVADIGLIMKK